MYQGCRAKHTFRRKLEGQNPKKVVLALFNAYARTGQRLVGCGEDESRVLGAYGRDALRRSTIEVHPNFSEAPSSLKGLHTAPENQLEQKSKFHPEEKSHDPSVQ